MAITIQIELDEHGAVKDVKRLEQSLKDLDKSGKTVNTGLSKTNTLLSTMKKILPSVTAAWLGWKALNLGKEMLSTAGAFERMQISLDTITKGQGQRWFKELNEWARTMPVNTEQAIQSFQMMKAMGLDPVIKDMTILVDTTSALGGQADTLTGIARALGQMVTKGKVSAEELRQLAEHGVPAYQILQEQLGLTAEQVADIGNESIDARKAVDALITGMGARFGGQSAKIRDTYAGIMEEIRSNWKEWTRLMMDSGPFDFVKGQLKDIRDLTGEMVDSLERTQKNKEAEEWIREQNIQPKIKGDTFLMLGSGGFITTRDVYDISDYKRYENERRIKQAQMDAGLNQNGQWSVPTSPGQTDYTPEMRAWFKNYSEAMAAFSGNRSPVTFTPENPQLGRFTNTPIPQNGELAAFRAMGLGDWEQRPVPGLTSEEIQARNERILDLRRELADQSVILAENQYKAEIDLLNERFEQEYGMLGEHDEERLLAAQKLANDIQIVNDRAMDEMENRLMRFTDFFTSMLGSLRANSAITFENIAKDFANMATSMGEGAVISGLLNLIPGVGPGGGFMAGASTFLGSFFKSGSFDSGGYTGSGNPFDIAGVVHAREYVMPRDVVDRYGPSSFDRLVEAMRNGGDRRTININQSFSSRERQEMMNESDAQLAERFNRLIEDRKVVIS